MQRGKHIGLRRASATLQPSGRARGWGRGIVRRVLVGIVCAGLAAGCLPRPQHLRGAARLGPPERVLPALPDRCGVADFRRLTGQPFTALAGQSLPGPLRVIYPDQMVTAEVLPTRLNVQIDAASRIRHLFCG